MITLTIINYRKLSNRNLCKIILMIGNKEYLCNKVKENNQGCQLQQNTIRLNLRKKEDLIKLQLITL